MVGVGQPMGQALPALGIAIGSQELVSGTPMKDEKGASASKRTTIMVGVGQPILHRAGPMSQALPTLGSTIRSQRLVLGTLTKDRKSASASKRTTDIGKPMGRLPKVGRRARSMGQALPAPRGTTPNQKFAPTVLTIGKPLCKSQCESGQSKHRCEKTRPWTSPENQKRSDSAKVGIPTEHGWIRSISSGH